MKTHLKVIAVIAAFIGAVVLGVLATPVFIALMCIGFGVLLYSWLYLILS